MRVSSKRYMLSEVVVGPFRGLDRVQYVSNQMVNGAARPTLPRWPPRGSGVQCAPRCRGSPRRAGPSPGWPPAAPGPAAVGASVIGRVPVPAAAARMWAAPGPWAGGGKIGPEYLKLRYAVECSVKRWRSENFRDGASLYFCRLRWKGLGRQKE